METKAPEFSEQFLSYVCLGDSISVDVGEYTVTAKIAHDDTPDKPDERDCGFWPSLDRKAAGYIGEGKTNRDYTYALNKAEEILCAWEQGEWFYCGIILSVSIDETELTDHAASLWGIEVNYPNSENAYLSQVANELLADALDAATRERTRLCSTLRERGMTRLKRTVSRLLYETYSTLGDSFIQDCLLVVWERQGNGEAVAAEAFVALECAARDVTQNKRITFAKLEDTEPDLIKALFKRAIEITESKLPAKARAI